MDEVPIAQGLFVCDRAIIEEGTRNVSLIGCSRRRFVSSLPGSLGPSMVYAILVNGRGTIPLELRVTNLRDGETVASYEFRMTFHNPLSEYRMIAPLDGIEFPETGDYEIAILSTGEPLATARLELSLLENQP